MAFDYWSEGFLTPEPIAFIECSKGGLLAQSYFISLTQRLYSAWHPLSSDGQDGLIKDLVGFAHQLHRRGIYHMDFSNGNILCKKQNDHFQFSLVDNNRMQFKKFNYSKALETFKRLGLTTEQLTDVAKEYCQVGKCR